MTKHYAKKREPVCAVQWLGGEKTAELTALLGQRGYFNAATGKLELGGGWYARPADWILSTSGEDVVVMSDEVFRKLYEEVDEIGLVPTNDEHETSGNDFVQQLEVLLVTGLRLSREEHLDIFRDRDSIVRGLRRLLEDHALVTDNKL